MLDIADRSFIFEVPSLAAIKCGRHVGRVGETGKVLLAVINLFLVTLIGGVVGSI